MIRIRQCNISFQDPITDRQRARITKRRIEDILSAHFKRFDNFEGTIRLKNLKIDLGIISDLEFEFNFFNGFEKACEELVKEIETVQRSENAKASNLDSIAMQSISGAGGSSQNKLTTGSNKNKKSNSDPRQVCHE